METSHLIAPQLLNSKGNFSLKHLDELPSKNSHEIPLHLLDWVLKAPQHLLLLKGMIPCHFLEFVFEEGCGALREGLSIRAVPGLGWQPTHGCGFGTIWP